MMIQEIPLCWNPFYSPITLQLGLYFNTPPIFLGTIKIFPKIADFVGKTRLKKSWYDGTQKYGVGIEKQA